MYNIKIQKTLDYYDGIAKGYSELYHEEQNNKISKVINYLPKEGNVLDLGSGDGVFNKFILKDVSLISLDLSFELLKLNSNCKKINASILNLPLKSEKFDFIVSFSVFQDLPDVLISINEVYRILKKNGVFIVSFLHMSLKTEDLIQHLEKKFELIEKIKETKDYILVLRKC